jgi:cysteine-rich repeat protein
MATRSIRLVAGLVAALAAACGGGDGDDDGGGGGAVCGDSQVGAGEQCDDGNTTSGDGCSATCQLEGDAVCGDGVVATSEGCDDGDTEPGDGCDAGCAVEDGWSCSGEPSVCVEDVPLVPDGSCAAPFPIELTLDEGFLIGEPTGDTTGGTDQVGEETCNGFDSGAGFDHIWQLTLTEASDVYLLGDESSTFDTVFRVLASPCDLASELPEFPGADGCDDRDGATEFMVYVGLPAGTYYVVLDGFTADDFGAYSFFVAVEPTRCGDGALDDFEFCDDGNLVDGDGCNARCEPEDGFTCDLGEPSVCTPDAGRAPAAGDLVLNEFMAADNVSDTNCDGSTQGNADEFVELVNVSGDTLNLTGVTIADAVTTRHVFGALSVPAGKAVVVWGGGAPACVGVTRFEKASTGQLGLNDNGDTITVATAGGAPLVAVTYGQAALNVSSNLSPDVTGTSYALHSAVPGAVGSFSPGRRADSTAF